MARHPPPNTPQPGALKGSAFEGVGTPQKLIEHQLLLALCSPPPGASGSNVGAGRSRAALFQGRASCKIYRPQNEMKMWSCLIKNC